MPVTKPQLEEPDALIALVRVCGGCRPATGPDGPIPELGRGAKISGEEDFSNCRNSRVARISVVMPIHSRIQWPRLSEEEMREISHGAGLCQEDGEALSK
jgi:hypothetical protein